MPRWVLGRDTPQGPREYYVTTETSRDAPNDALEVWTTDIDKAARYPTESFVLNIVAEQGEFPVEVKE